MEDLSIKELQDSLNTILKLVVCPVCLETLTPKVKLCVKGHAVCEACHQRLQRAVCPMCRNSFSSVQPTGILRQIIETLPHPCRYKTCDYFVRTDDSHEETCPFKPTKCRYCSWSGPENSLIAHIMSKHEDYMSYLFPLIGSLMKGIPFDPKQECSVFTPIVVDGHFFWGEMKNQPHAEKLTAIFHPVANGITKVLFQGSVKLGLEGGYSAHIKLNMDSEADPYTENCISINTSILHKFTVDNKLEYRITVDIIRLESLVTFMNLGIKSGVDWLRSLRNNK